MASGDKMEGIDRVRLPNLIQASGPGGFNSRTGGKNLGEGETEIDLSAGSTD